MRKVLLISLMILMFGTTVASAGDWSHEVGIYGWLAGLDGTIGIGDVAESDLTATFDDLKDFVDFAMAGHYEARGSKSVWLADVSYTGLGASQDAVVHDQTVTAKGDLDQWIIEMAGGYRVTPKVDILIAGRYYILDTGLKLSATDKEKSGSIGLSWFDIFLGARYHTTFGSSWFASIRGDIGTGGSDFAWFGQVALGYKFSQHWGATVAWRILDLDYSGDDGESYLKYDVTQNGLGLAVGYQF